MSRLYLYFIILQFVAVNSKSLNIEEVTFENVTVPSDKDDFCIADFNMLSKDNLNEYLCRSLQKIVIVGSPFSTLRKNSVSDLSRLHVLKIIVTNLEHIEPGAFKNLSNIYQIDLSDNHLKEVEEGVFNNLPVKNLDLGYNAIARIAPRAFDNMTYLTHISLPGNKIIQYDLNWFQNVPKLQELDFGANLFEELPDNAFQNLKDNTPVIPIRAYFYDCSLKRVGNNLLGGLKEVRLLDLHDNEIEAFGDGVLNGVETIDVFYLSQNKINCFSGNLSRIFVAKKTEVYENPLTLNEQCMKTISLWENSPEGQGHKIVKAWSYH